MTMHNEYSGLEIAIVGLDCQFPGAKDPQAYRAAIASGTDLITHFDTKTLRDNGVSDDLLDDDAYVHSHGVLQDFDKFDPKVFGINRSEAELIDPQLRLLLQCGYRALENAAIVPEADDPCGVYVGAYYNTYRDIALRAGLMDRTNDAFMVNILNEKDFLATQLAYRLNLSGPAVTVQTACSTSLVAVHMACQALLAGECNVALAGGATCRPKQTVGYEFQDGGIYAPDGMTRTFDADAAGTVPSNGAGIIVLKRLEDAIADGDTIRAVIRGSAIGNDGSQRVGFTAPSVSGQARIIANALAASNLDPASISYIEAHGSGTAIGDPIEIKALTSAYGREAASRDRPIGIGSVKTNIGHTHAASGVAGLIKTVFALEDKWLPPSLNYNKPNPMISFDDTPFRVVQKGEDWAEGTTARRAAVSSFGMGGTGAHVVLEEAPERPKRSAGKDRNNLLLISAASTEALERNAVALSDVLLAEVAPHMDDVAYTLHAGRKVKEHRMAIVASDAQQASTALRGNAPDHVAIGASNGRLTDIDFLLPGLGDQRPGMIEGLYRQEPVFRSALDRSFEILADKTDTPFPKVLIMPSSAKSKGIDLRQMMGRKNGFADQEHTGLSDTAVAQPAVFAIEYALAQQWMSWGVTPKRMIGYSLGEYVAACLSGVFDLEDALHVVARRSQAIAELATGTMLAVGLAPNLLEPMLPTGVSIAAINGPELCVVAGAPADIQATNEKLTSGGIQCRPVQSTHAFHTPLLEPAIPALTACLSGVTLNAPKIPYLSNVSGDWITTAQAIDPAYWARHMCETVQFYRMIATLFETESRAVLEVGPGQSTASLLAQVANQLGKNPLIVSSLPSPFDDRNDHTQMLRAAGRLWVEGVELGTRAIHGAQSCLTQLPSYQFDKERFWIDDAAKTASKPKDQIDRSDRSNWYSSIGWRRIETGPSADSAAARWLVVGGSQITAAVSGKVLADNPTVKVQTVDWPMAQDGCNLANVATLTKSISEFAPTGILYLSCLDEKPETASPHADFDQAQTMGFEALLGVVQAIADRLDTGPLELIVATPAAWCIHGEEGTRPAFSTCLGIIKTVPHEMYSVRARVVDLPPACPIDQVARLLSADVLLHDRPDLVVIRANRHWTPDVQSLRLPPPVDTDKWKDGVFLITGGTGALGLVVAERLAKRGACAVILISRSEVKDEKMGPAGGHTRPALDQIRGYGTTVVFERANVADAARLSDIVSRNITRFGRIDGAFHTAGVEGGGLMQLKSASDSRKVMSPKCHGALSLLNAVLPVAPKFVMLFSSSIAITGAQGQSDYSAANTFLDTLALAHDENCSTQVVSVNWDAWRDAGMAHRNLAATADWQKIDHPFLMRVMKADKQTIYEADISDSDWLVDEHRMDDHAVVAGTGQIEFIRAATTHALTGRCGVGADPILIKDLIFLSPAVIPNGGGLKLRIVLSEKRDGEFAASSATQPIDEPQAPWRLHVKATTAALTEKATTPPADIAALIARDHMTYKGAPQHIGPMKFGPRSLCLRHVYDGGEEAIAEIMLPTPFADETTTLPLHPSVMDISAAFVGLHLAKRFRIPLSYGAFRFYGPLAGKIFSHHRLHATDTGADIVTADVTIYDQAGAVLVEVFDFVLKRIDDVDGHMNELLSGTSREIMNTEVANVHAAVAPLAGQLDHGLSSTEGADAIESILCKRVGANIAVSTRSIDEIIQSLTDKEPQTPAPATEKATARRNTASPYIAPRTKTEVTIAALWSDLLNLNDISVHDNFFELGGHSLLGLSLATRLRETFKADLPVSIIFRNLTIERLAETIETAEFAR